MGQIKSFVALEEQLQNVIEDIEVVDTPGLAMEMSPGESWEGLFRLCLERRKEELESHIALQDRNEKLRIQNQRLIDIIMSVRKALRD